MDPEEQKSTVEIILPLIYSQGNWAPERGGDLLHTTQLSAKQGPVLVPWP